MRYSIKIFFGKRKNIICTRMEHTRKHNLRTQIRSMKHYLISNPTPIDAIRNLH